MKKIFIYSIIILIALSLLKIYFFNSDKPVSFYNFILELSSIKFEFSSTISAFEGISINFNYILNSFTDCTSTDFWSLLLNFFALLASPVALIFSVLFDLITILQSVFTFLFRILSIGY